MYMAPILDSCSFYFYMSGWSPATIAKTRIAKDEAGAAISIQYADMSRYTRL